MRSRILGTARVGKWAPSVGAPIRHRLFSRAAGLVLLALFAAGAGADVGLRIEEAWIRLLPGDLPLGGYFTLANDRESPATLVGAKSDAFERVMMHESVEEGGAVRMQHVDALEVPSGDALRFAPGGYHLMLMGRQGALSEGDRLPITLIFDDGCRVTAEFTVRHAAAQ